MKSDNPTPAKDRQKRPAVKPCKAALKPKRAKGVHVPPKFVGSLVALADVLGVARQTLTRWHREPGNPGKRSDGRYEVAAWQKFLQGRSRFGGGLDGYRAKCRHIQLQNEILELQIAELTRKYVRFSDVTKWAPELCESVKSIVRGSLTRLAAELRLLSVPDAESMLKDAETRILTRMHTLGTG